MNVRLTAQVLSESVGKVLLSYGPEEAAATVKFCFLMDQFFDCGNVKNTKSIVPNKRNSSNLIRVWTMKDLPGCVMFLLSISMTGC